MPDPRSVMKEFRSLDHKRAAGGLTPDEEARYEHLRDLVAPDPMPAPRGGFDVEAAAAQLRDSLLPAGLRNRPPPPPGPPAPAEDASTAAAAFASAYSADPAEAFELLPPDDVADSALPADGAAPWDPAALASEPAQAAWDPSAPYDPAAGGAFDPNAGYDPNAAFDANAPYDPAAQQAGEQRWDASAQPYDPNAPGYDPNAPGYDTTAQAYDPAAQGYDPNAQPYDPAAQAYDPNAQPFDPAAQPYDPNAQPFDPAAQAYDPNAQPFDPAAQAYDPNAQPFDPAAQAYDPNAQPFDPAAQAYDPNAQPLDLDAQPYDAAAQGYAEPAPLDAASQTWEAAPQQDATSYDADAPIAPAALSYDPNASPDAGVQPYPEPDPLATAEGDLFGEPGSASGAFAPEPEAAGSGGWETPETGHSTPAEGAGVPDGEDGGLESLLPFDPAAEAAITAGEVPDGFGDERGEYDDTAGFTGHDPDTAPADLPQEEPGFQATQAVEPEATEGWQPDVVLEDGFHLASGGSFDATAEAAAPEWAGGTAAPPWETPAAGADAAPAPEPTSEPVAEDALAHLAAASAATPAEPGQSPEDAFAAAGEAEFAVDVEEAPAEGLAADPSLELPAPPADASGAGALEEDIPTIEGEDILEELPPEEVELIATEGGDAAEDPLAEDPEPPEPAPEHTLSFAMPTRADADADPVLAFAEPPAEHADPALAPAEPPAGEAEPFAGIAEADEAAAAEDFAAAAAEPPPPPAPPFVDPVPSFVDPAPAPAEAALPEEPEPESMSRAQPEPEPAAPAGGWAVPGTHRVVVHTIEGLVKRGVLEDADLGAESLRLAPQAGAASEPVASEKVKAIFFMMAPGEKAPPPEGKKVRVTFRDGRQVAGFSPDYQETGIGFFMIPVDTRTNTGRIWVYRSAVRQVSVT